MPVQKKQKCGCKKDEKAIAKPADLNADPLDHSDRSRFRGAPSTEPDVFIYIYIYIYIYIHISYYMTKLI